MKFDKAYNYFMDRGFSKTRSTVLAEIAVDAEDVGKNLLEILHDAGTKMSGFLPEKVDETVKDFLLQ